MSDESCRLETPNTATASFNSNALDLGAGFAPGGVGIAVLLQSTVTALTTGGPTYAMKLQQSDDSVTWVDASELEPITAAGVNGVAGLVSKRYVRRAVVIGGSGSPSISSDAILAPVPRDKTFAK